MKIRILILMILALSGATGSAYMAKNWLANERAEILASVPSVPVFKEEKVEILVAKSDLIPGSFILKNKLSWQEWPEDALNDQMLKKGDVEKDDFEGYVIRDRISAGQPLVPSAIVQSGEQGFLAAVLAPGMRAVSVPINDTTGVAGFVFPGDKVDLIHTVTLKPEGENPMFDHKFDFSQTLLKNVRVLAKGQSAEQAEGEVEVSDTATIEVTPKQAEAVALALYVGKLSMSLRSLAEEDQVFPEVFSAPENEVFPHDVAYPKQLVSSEQKVNGYPEFLQRQNPNSQSFQRLEIKDDFSLTTELDVNFLFQKMLRQAPITRSGGRSGGKVQIQRGSNSTVKEFN